MALSGNYTTIVPGTQSQVAIKISWTATQSVTANTSTVKTTVQLVHKTYGLITGASTKSYTLNVNGNKHTGSASINGSNNTTSTITTSTDTINHTSTGVGKLAITFSISMGIAWSGVTVPTCNVPTKYFALTTIPRQSTMSSVASTTLGSPVTMTITAHSSSYTHVIDARFGSTIIQTWKDLKAGKQSLTFNSSATSAITARMGTGTSVQIDWVMSTHSGTTQIGSMATAKSTVSLPSSELAPTVGTISASEANSDATSRFTAGSYVQNVSQLRLSVTGSSATHGATIKSTVISFEGKTYSSGATSDVISGSGNLKVTATVTDSRGQSASKSITVLVTAYQPPQVMTAVATRSNSSGGFVTDGQYCSVVYSVASSDLPLINGKNTLTLNFSKQEAGAASFTQVRTILVPDVKGEGTAVLGDGYDGTKDYNIKLVATDAAGMSTTVMIGLDVAHVLMSWGKTQVGIGKVAENGTLDVLGDTYIKGDLVQVADDGTQFHNDPNQMKWHDLQPYLNTDSFKIYPNAVAHPAPRYRINGTHVDIQAELTPLSVIKGSTTKVELFTGLPFQLVFEQVQLMVGSGGADWMLSTDTSGHTIYFSRYAKGGTWVDTSTSTWVPIAVTLMLE
ncbi:DUF859 family phage minor structural protein [Lacticaseibacillus suihuaensis]